MDSIKKMVAAGAAAGLLTLTGCGSDEPDFGGIAREDTSDYGGFDEADDPYPMVDGDTTDDTFVSALRDGEYGYEFTDSTDEEIIDVGETICEAIDEGVTFEVLYDQGQEAGFTGDATATLIGYAVGAYCPENEYVFD